MSKLSAALVAVVFATSAVTVNPAWADRGFGRSGYGAPSRQFHADNYRDRGNHDRRNNGWAIGLGLLAGTAILLAAAEPRPVISSQPVAVYTSRPAVYVTPAPSPTVYVAPPTQWWYYCAQPAGYYPYVNQCLTGWTKVTPRPPG